MCFPGSGQWHVSQAGSSFGEDWLKHQVVLFLSEDPKDKMIQFSIPLFYSSAYLGKLSWFQLLNRLYRAHGASSVQDGFKSEVLAEFHFQNFMSRAYSFNFMSCPPRLSSTECTVYTVYVNLCMYDVYVWRLFGRSDRHPQGFARNKASAQRRRGSDSQHCWTGLDSL